MYSYIYGRNPVLEWLRAGYPAEKLLVSRELSGAALQEMGRRVAAALGSRTEAYRVLRHRAVDRELARHGFRVIARHRQFVLPIALHKAIGSRAFTLGTEKLMARGGLLRLLGSPVTVVAARDRDGAR